MSVKGILKGIGLSVLKTAIGEVVVKRKNKFSPAIWQMAESTSKRLAIAFLYSPNPYDDVIAVILAAIFDFDLDDLER